MDIIITAVVFFIIFSVLVLIHEFGHFFVARLNGIKVEEFGMGLPPRIWGKKKGDTLYSINWIPFGGFVRLYGEDSRNKKMLKNKKSFVSKTPLQRAAVLVAGVFMNFVLTIVCLTVSFMIGVQPIIASISDIFEQVEQGNIVLEEGIFVDTVEEEFSKGLEPGDHIISFDGNPIDSSNIVQFVETFNGVEGAMDVELSDGTELMIDPVEGSYPFSIERVVFNYDYYLYFYDKSNDFADLGFESGDVVYKIDSEFVSSLPSISEALIVADSVTVMRDGEETIVSVNGALKESQKEKEVFINAFQAESVASNYDIQALDQVTGFNDLEIVSSEQLRDFVSDNKEEGFNLKVLRGGEELVIDVKPFEDDVFGINLDDINVFDSNVALFSQPKIYSLKEIKDIKLGFGDAFMASFNESYRLAVLTVSFFGDMIVSIFESEGVPDGVAGPVGIAQMTHAYVGMGFAAILQWTALLSLSLAVINILPFPALDGGRLLFVIYEIVSGQKPSLKWEARIHALGYIFLLGLIILVTYNDIVRIFS